MQKGGFVYLMANAPNGTTYLGVTSDIRRRAYEHREELIDGFSKKYACHLLVWYEHHDTIESAIMREKHIKKWNRGWKKALIEKNNPSWDDLYPTLNH